MSTDRSQDKFVLHYLTDSRASRIVWLMEELELNYELKIYPRGSDYLAPKELKDVWPTGLSPVLEIYRNGSTKPLKLAESGQIVQYLTRHYDPKGTLAPATEEDEIMVDYYLHFAEGTLQPHLVSILVGIFAVKRAPWGTGPLVRTVVSKMNDLFYLKKVTNCLNFLEGQLEKKGGGYMVGDKLTGADILLEFPLVAGIFGDSQRMSAAGIHLDFSKYPNLVKWSELVSKEPKHLKALEAEKKARSKL